MERTNITAREIRDNMKRDVSAFYRHIAPLERGVE